MVRRGELLVGMDGNFNCARWGGPDGLLNQRVCKITPDAEHLDLEYLTVALPGYLRAIHDMTSSTTVTHLSSEDIAQIPLPVPPLPLQRTFSSVIDAAGSKASASASHLTMARRAIERFRHTVLDAACSGRLTPDWREGSPGQSGDDVLASSLHERAQVPKLARKTVEFPAPELLGELPDSWVAASVDQLCPVVTDGEHRTPPRTDEGVPLLSARNVLNGDVVLEPIDQYLRRPTSGSGVG
jgi:type I restriction enzyme, S subunit